MGILVAQTTKRALEASLKKLLLRKPLNKITINDITEDCGVNRMTFYYHFKDIYDLVDWILVEDATEALEGHQDFETWSDAFRDMLEKVQANRVLVLNVYRSISREQVEQYLYKMLDPLLRMFIERENIPVQEEDKQFIIDFYKYGFVGMVLEWIRRDMKTEPAIMAERLNTMMHGDLKRALLRFSTDGRASKSTNDKNLNKQSRMIENYHPAFVVYRTFVGKMLKYCQNKGLAKTHIRRQTFMSIALEPLSHKVQRAAVGTMVDVALAHVRKDRQKVFAEMVDVAKQFYGDSFSEETYEHARAVLTDADSKWSKLINCVLDQTAPNVARTTALNLGYEAFFRGTKTIRENRTKYHCNIPWLILFDPTSACNMHCVGCWAGEYGHKTTSALRIWTRSSPKARSWGSISICSPAASLWCGRRISSVWRKSTTTCSLRSTRTPPSSMSRSVKRS